MDDLPAVLELMHRAAATWETVQASVRLADGRVERVWYVDDSRWRIEEDAGDGGGFLHVQAGGRSVRRDPNDRNANTWQGSWGDADQRSHRFLWDPNPLIPEMWLEPEGREVVAGREGIRVTGRPRPTSHDVVVIDAPADAYGLVVDAERGVVLRLRCTLEGRDTLLEEVERIRFDEPLADDLFAMPSPR